MIHSSCKQRRPGAAAVEFAMLLPVLLILLLGIWEVARLLSVQQLLLSAVREGGRIAAVGQSTNTTVQSVVLHYLNNAGVQVTDAQDNPLPGVVVSVTNNTSPGVDASKANQLDYFTISVTVPYKSVQWATLNYFVQSGTNMNAAVGWYSMKNIPLTISQTIPGQPQ